jgi:branched-chain amino acid transport system ATP-binding protein
MPVILETKGLSKQFGGLRALEYVSIKIHRGEIFGLIGPNGSGKTTLLNVITGYLKPNAGTVTYKGQPIEGSKPHRIAERGITRTFQITSTFAGLTPLENVIAGSFLKGNGTIWGSFFRTKSYLYEEQRMKINAMGILDFMEITRKQDSAARDLPAVEQRKLEIAIALATEPDLLLLDEPAAGMNPEEQGRLVRHIRSLRERGITIALVEHNMRVIMGLCDRIATLNHGRVIAEGSPQDIINDQNVVSIYLGRKRVNAQG